MLTEADGLKIKAIDAQIKQLGEQKAQILRDAEVDLLPVGNHVDGRVLVTVSQNRRFDSELAMEAYPLGPNGENLELYDATISSTKAKALLPPAEYAKLQKIFPKNKVEVKIND